MQVDPWAVSILVAFVIQLAVVIYGYGRLTERVGGLKDAVSGLTNQLNAGPSCKLHSEIVGELGEIRGKINVDKRC
jgi:hypothetical protein